MGSNELVESVGQVIKHIDNLFAFIVVVIITIIDIIIVIAVIIDNCQRIMNASTRRPKILFRIDPKKVFWALQHLHFDSL